MRPSPKAGESDEFARRAFAPSWERGSVRFTLVLIFLANGKAACSQTSNVTRRVSAESLLTSSLSDGWLDKS
jgi:hypothetical protein